MTATEKQITVKPFYKDFDFFTDGFQALAELDETFYSLFNGVGIPKPPTNRALPAAKEIETEAQMKFFGSLVDLTYYTDPDSPNRQDPPIVGLNSFEFKLRSGAIHFKVERMPAPPRQKHPWRFTVFPGQWDDTALMNFKRRFKNAVWNESDDLNETFSEIVRDARRM